MDLNGVISHLLSLGSKLLPAVGASSSSSPPDDENKKIESELAQIIRMLKRIKATLYDAEQREIRDLSVRLWLEELQEVAYDAEDVLDEYHYEVLRAQVEARDASSPDSCRRKLIQVPDGMFDQIKQIRSKFAEIEKDRIALRLLDEDGPRRRDNELQIAPTGHDIDASAIFGRKREMEKLIKLLSFVPHGDQVVSVVAIVGTGGIGKTTLAQLAFKDQKIRQRFDKFGWICVSDDFNIERLMRELIQSITKSPCGLTNISALQEEIKEVIEGEKILLVLDDVWNEKRSLWELFHACFKSASFVKILVTTRNKHVAQIMQTEPTIQVDYLSEEQCWQLFKQYAFNGDDQNIDSNFIEMGKQMLKKCGMLPLAVKAISSLLKHEMNKESWREILESELWESEASSEIFPPLQLSYAHLPTYLKPCFIYCSMFPKDFRYDIEELVQLWISQGYIESKGKKNVEEIGWEYAKQLWQRSLFESSMNSDNTWSWCKMHDMIHDLARLNSKDACFSTMEASAAKLSEELVEPIPFGKFTTLRTPVIMGFKAEKKFSSFDLSMSQKLRAIKVLANKLEYFSSVGILRHLRYLVLERVSIAIPECICSLYNLKSLEIRNCNFDKLPTRVGNLLSLERLIILGCNNLRKLPESLCQLKALRIIVLEHCELLELPKSIGNPLSLETVVIQHCDSIKRLPESFRQLKAYKKLDISSFDKVIGTPGLSKIGGVQTLSVDLKCDTIGWLKDFDLGGALTLSGLKNISSLGLGCLADVKCAILVSMRNVDRLTLCWGTIFSVKTNYYQEFSFSIKSCQNILLEERNDCAVMASLQPHSNLRELYIMDYDGISFPEWIGNPSSCALLERVHINSCINLMSLPFGNLHTLKYLNIIFCDSLLSIEAEWLPLKLEKLHISECRQLSCVSGLQKLSLLRTLKIQHCRSFNKQLFNAGVKEILFNVSIHIE